MDKSVTDPPIPYIGPVHGGRFGPGKRLRIQGIAPSIAYRFDINLQCGPQTAPRDDIAVQVSVQILDGYISTNFLQDGVWGEEQKAALPIRRAEKFEITLACGFSHYEVDINGKHHCTYPHKIHYDRISHLAIEGDVSIVEISYEAGGGDGITGSSVPYPHNDGFEVVNPYASGAPPAGLNPAPPPGISLPSYGTAMPRQETPPCASPCPDSPASNPPAVTGKKQASTPTGQRFCLTCLTFFFMVILISLLVWTVSRKP